MSVWTEINEDARYTGAEQVTTGRRLGFIDSLQNAYTETALYYSQFGAEHYFKQEEAENIYRVRKVGGVAPDPLGYIMLGLEPMEPTPIPGAKDTAQYLDSYKPYTEYIRGLVGARDDRMPPVSDRDKELAKLKAQYPDAGIKTYQEMWSSVKDKLAAVQRKAQHSTNWAGTLGWLLGSAGGAIDPRVNPINFVTLPVGGLGKSALSRILTQGLGQGAAETVTQITGERENQRLLGGNPTIGDTLSQIAMTGVGGAGIQGAGEVLAKGVGFMGRKWFRPEPGPTLPPPQPVAPPVKPPAPKTIARSSEIRRELPISREADQRITQAVRETIGPSRNTARVSRADFLHVKEQLDDWAGPNPWEIPPPTHTRVFDPNAPLPQVRTPTLPLGGETVDEIARRIDPDTFRLYDKFNDMKDMLRESVGRSRALRTVALDKELQPLNEQINGLKAKLETATKRNVKKLEPRIAELERQRDAIVAERTAQDTPQMAKTREGVMRMDERMRDLAPAVSRAYARARGKWTVAEGERAEIERMMAGERTTPAPPKVIDEAEKGLDEQITTWLSPTNEKVAIPELQSSLAKPVPEGKDVADEVIRVQAEEAKLADESVDAFRAQINQLLSAKPKEGEPPTSIQLPGMTRPMSLDDVITIVREDDTVERMNIRDLLEEIEDDTAALKAITSCRVKAPE